MEIRNLWTVQKCLKDKEITFDRTKTRPFKIEGSFKSFKYLVMEQFPNLLKKMHFGQLPSEFVCIVLVLVYRGPLKKGRCSQACYGKKISKTSQHYQVRYWGLKWNWGRLQFTKKLRLCSIYKKGTWLPFAYKFRLSFICKHIEVVFHLPTYWSTLPISIKLRPSSICQQI